MKTDTIISFIFYLSIFLLPIDAMSGPVKVSFPQIKLTRVSGDHIYYAVKTEVNNQSSREDVCITFQALDFEGFEIESSTLCGKVPPNGVRVLTDTSIMRTEDWNRINKWQRKE